MGNMSDIKDFIIGLWFTGTVLVGAILIYNLRHSWIGILVGGLLMLVSGTFLRGYIEIARRTRT